jgi:hypothetical protein
VIRERARRLLSRLRPVPAAAAAPQIPPRRWADDLNEAGLSAPAWLAARQTGGRLFVDLPDQCIERLRRQYPDRVRATVAAADRVLRHEFDLLGSGSYTPVDPDRRTGENGYRPIDWHLDPVAGLRFPQRVPLSAWNFEQMRPAGADIKLPWELARCQHWPVLGQAYRLTRDDRFASEIARELRDFMDANPVGTAVNWACTMDVALRAANWAVALEMIRCADLPEDFWHFAYEALFDHGAFIERHLENHYEVTSNHFLSNVVGLFYIAAVFRDVPRGRLWDRQCRDWLAEEMDVQVLADGADYESSIPYHRLVSELFLGAARLAGHAGEPLPARSLDRLATMIDYLAAVLRPDRLMPQVGDADDGRLHILSGYGTWKPQDPDHLFGPAACLLRRADWLHDAGEAAEWEAEWWGFEPSALERPAAGAARTALRHFPHAGLTAIRREGDYLLVTNGIVGTGGFGNHKHNDLLSFEYHAAGEPVIVDPGSYVYTPDPDARNLFRSTRSHNTLSIDDQEQNDIRPEWLFRMFEKASPEHVAVGEDADTLEYHGRHRGYTRLRDPIVHDRAFTIRRRDGSLAIVDILEGRGMHQLAWHFHFAPGVTVAIAAPNVVTINGARVRLRMMLPSDLAIAIGSGWYSPSYGVRLPCAVLNLETAASIDGRREYLFQLTSQ